MEFSQLAQERYSVRKFSEEPVDQDVLAEILTLANHAPTAVNKQPIRILQITSKEGMEKLKECTPYTFHAPSAFIVCAVESEAWVRPADGFNIAIVDASIVATHLMLAIHDKGLGSTWVGYFDPALICKNFSLPQGVVPVAIFPVGHPAQDAKPAPHHGKRRALDEIVIREQF